MLAMMENVNRWVDWLAESYGAPVISFGAVCLLLIHLTKRPHGLTLYILIICASVPLFVLLAIQPEKMTFARLASLILIYAVALFVTLSTLLRRSLAVKLTKWRGDKWLKEIDYIYLGLGSAGVLSSVNHLPFVTGKIEAGDMLAPVLLTTAIVIRFIKTRAEIGGWNKVEDTISPAPTPSPRQRMC